MSYYVLPITFLILTVWSFQNYLTALNRPFAGCNKSLGRRLSQRWRDLTRVALRTGRDTYLRPRCRTRELGRVCAYRIAIAIQTVVLSERQ